ncbi:MAG: hypothetical protein D6759_09750 [Chloroflexi bacterium]|nr:MAG: hypothetical protein D6759_09750 [Chloroflexota bacterium]
MKLVIDEWLWADLSGENQTERQTESVAFLLAAFERCDQLVTVVGSMFEQKFWNLAKRAQPGDLIRRRIVKMFRARFFYNSRKLERHTEKDLPPMPAEMENDVDQEDRYLVRVYLSSKADLLVTTDNALQGALHKHQKGHGVHCKLRDEFLKQYLSE